MPGLLGNAAHGVEHENGELGPRLVRLQIGGFHSPAEPRRRVAWPSLVHDHRNHVISTLLAGAKLTVHLRKIRVQLADDSFQRTLHPAIGNGWRSRTTVPVNVDPVVPVSSTVKYRPISESSPGSRTVLKSRVRA